MSGIYCAYILHPFTPDNSLVSVIYLFYMQGKQIALVCLLVHTSVTFFMLIPCTRSSSTTICFFFTAINICCLCLIIGLVWLTLLDFVIIVTLCTDSILFKERGVNAYSFKYPQLFSFMSRIVHLTVAFQYSLSSSIMGLISYELMREGSEVADITEDALNICAYISREYWANQHCLMTTVVIQAGLFQHCICL